jgi:ethanolamine utilization protein EutN
VFIGKVIGSIVSTIKHPVYQGRKVLLIRPTTPQGKPLQGTVVAVDSVHAGVGDRVLVAAGGGAAADILGLGRRVPLRSVVVAFIDTVDLAPVRKAPGQKRKEQK